MAVDALVAAALAMTFLAGVVILALPSDLRLDWWYWYRRYLDSRRWKRLSWQVKRRDNWTCQRCRADEAWHMEAHHLRYQRWWVYALRLPEPRRNLVCLCEDCHRVEHGKEE